MTEYGFLACVRWFLLALAAFTAAVLLAAYALGGAQ
jgi:hypothetical protein